MGFGGKIVIMDEAAIPIQPGKGPFDDPAKGHGYKALLRGWTGSHLKSEVLGFDGLGKGPPIARIGEHFGEPLPGKSGHEFFPPDTIGHVGSRDVDAPDAPAGIDGDVPFAAVDVLAAVEAARFINTRQELDNLRIHAYHRRFRRALVPLPVALIERRVELLPDLVLLPAPVVVVHRWPGRIVAGQGAPLAAGATHVPDGRHDVAQAVAALALGVGQDTQRGDNLPLAIGERLINVSHSLVGVGTPN